MKEQTHIPGTEPVEPNPEIKSALDQWLDAKDEQRQSSERTRRRHDTMIGKMVALGVDRYPYTDPVTGKKKHVLADRTPKAKIVNAPVVPKKEGRRGREKDVEIETISSAVESRRVTRTAEHDAIVDPFAATRAGMDE